MEVKLRQDLIGTAFLPNRHPTTALVADKVVDISDYCPGVTYSNALLMYASVHDDDLDQSVRVVQVCDWLTDIVGLYLYIELADYSSTTLAFLLDHSGLVSYWQIDPTELALLIFENA